MDDSSTTLSNTDLAFQRTQLAHERTLMAWVRTATSRITFGFSIYKIFQEINKETNTTNHKILTPRIVGIIMILIALTALLLAQMQHHIAIKELRTSYPAVRWSVASVISALIFAFGIILLLAAFFRQ